MVIKNIIPNHILDWLILYEITITTKYDRISNKIFLTLYFLVLEIIIINIIEDIINTIPENSILNCTNIKYGIIIIPKNINIFTKLSFIL